MFSALRWGPSSRTPSGCTTCWATCGNGRRIAGTGTIRVPPQTEAPGGRGIAPSVCCAAAPGALFRGASVRRYASGSRPGSGTATSDSASPGPWIDDGSRAHESPGLFEHGHQGDHVVPRQQGRIQRPTGRSEDTGAASCPDLPEHVGVALAKTIGDEAGRESFEGGEVQVVGQVAGETAQLAPSGPVTSNFTHCMERGHDVTLLQSSHQGGPR